MVDAFRSSALVGTKGGSSIGKGRVMGIASIGGCERVKGRRRHVGDS